MKLRSTSRSLAPDSSRSLTVDPRSLPDSEQFQTLLTIGKYSRGRLRRLRACAAGTSRGLNLFLKRFRKAQLVAVGVEQMKVSLAPFGITRGHFGIQALCDGPRIHG